jgi:hypothetical protein
MTQEVKKVMVAKAKLQLDHWPVAQGRKQTGVKCKAIVSFPSSAFTKERQARVRNGFGAQLFT